MPYRPPSPGDSTTRSSNMNPDRNPADFAMFSDQHNYFLWQLFATFVEYDVETSAYNYTVDATLPPAPLQSPPPCNPPPPPGCLVTLYVILNPLGL